MPEQNKKLNKEIQTIKKSPEILEWETFNN